jgi:hypothetical protein
MLAGVSGFVDAGLLAGAGGEQVGLARAEGFDVAEVEFLCAGNLGGSPGLAVVGGAKVGAVGAACPNDARRDGTDAAQVFNRAAV